MQVPVAKVMADEAGTVQRGGEDTIGQVARMMEEEQVEGAAVVGPVTKEVRKSGPRGMGCVLAFLTDDLFFYKTASQVEIKAGPEG